MSLAAATFTLLPLEASLVIFVRARTNTGGLGLLGVFTLAMVSVAASALLAANTMGGVADAALIGVSGVVFVALLRGRWAI